MPARTNSIDDFLDDFWTSLPPISDGDRQQEAHPAAQSVESSAGKTVLADQPFSPRPGAVSRSLLEGPLPRSPSLNAKKTGFSPVYSAGPPTYRSAVAGTDTGGQSFGVRSARFVPLAPDDLRQAGVNHDEVARILLKLLAARGAVTGRGIARHMRLPFRLVEGILNAVRKEQLVVLKGDAIAGDYTYIITERGFERARVLSRECTYFGSTPVPLKHYVDGITRQSSRGIPVRIQDLQDAFSDLLLEPTLLNKLGPAINSGRGLFLFGEPGNGKTSIAERVSRSFGSTIWIPRAIAIDGQIIRIFDPAIHRQVSEDTANAAEYDSTEIDQRWIQIIRPTVIAGGELTMAELEVSQDKHTKICEAPLQLKSNGGVLLIDDFGRQRMPVDELLNRWIVPLENHYDLLNPPNGKKVQVPFDQLVIFSTNLEPRDLVDDAFLRRIPYKIEVTNPSPLMFHNLFQAMCGQIGVEYRADAINYLIQEHYIRVDRSLKACHPRDLLMQIHNFCIFNEKPIVLTKDSIDFAVNCYFSVLS
ncbi:MAG: AAA family ATPase [Planctomycetaceae bacterium]